MPRRQSVVKRSIDATVAVFAMILLSPVMVAVSVVVLVSMGRPVLFRQTRPGLHAVLFPLLKFRTMREETDAERRNLPDAARLTPVGTWLRRLSLDELPQLWNVLRGNMSLVGPRPLLMEYLSHYSAEQARRHDVRPGLTGWAQVNGRNALNWEQKFALDLWYVDHWGLVLDVKILAITVWRVLKREGITNARHATMPKFVGSNHGRLE